MQSSSSSTSSRSTSRSSRAPLVHQSWVLLLQPAPLLLRISKVRMLGNSALTSPLLLPSKNRSIGYYELYFPDLCRALTTSPLWLKACTQLTAGLQGGQQEELDRAKCDIQHIALQWELLHWASNNHKHRAYYSSPVEVCNAMGAINKRQKVTTWGGDRHSTHNSTNHYHDENIREYQARSLQYQQNCWA